MKLSCPYCNKLTEIKLNPDEQYPHTGKGEEVYWVFDCKNCLKPFRVNFHVRYTPTTVETYNEIKCERCGKHLYEGRDPIAYKDLHGSNPTKFMLELNDYVFGGYNVLCKGCHCGLCEEKLGDDRRPGRLKALIGFDEE